MKILIADDHWIIRESIKHVLTRINAEFEPLEAANFDEAVTMLEANPDTALMVLDLIMPGFDEFAGLKKLRNLFPNIPVVIISVHEDREYILESINHGVVGYIPKSTNGADMVESLSRVIEGDVTYPRHILVQTDQTAESDNNRDNKKLKRSRHASEVNTEKIENLTAREREVIHLLGQGLSDAKIAKSLGISPSTVRAHMRSTMQKLNLSDRAQAIHYAVSLNEK